MHGHDPNGKRMKEHGLAKQVCYIQLCNSDTLQKSKMLVLGVGKDN